MSAPAHLEHVLGALREGGVAATPDRDEAISWRGVCPCCGGGLEVRDVLWQDRGRRIRLYCSRCDERRILDALRVRERELFLDRARPPDLPWVAFRKRILTRLNRIDRSRYWYIDANRSIHGCPVCRDGWLSVRFIGTTPRAEIECSFGCSDDEVAAALGLEVLS